MIAIHTLLSRLRKAAADARGSVLVPVALAMPLVVGVVSLGIEGGLWFASKRDLQSAADAGAISGAWEVANQSSAATIASVAAADARRNANSDNLPFTVSVNSPPVSGAYVGDASAVEVTVRRSEELLLARLILDNMEISSRAVAQSGQLGDYCVLALDKASADTAEFQGNATINLVNCGVAANSSNSEALLVSGSAKLTASFIETVGGYAVTGSGQLNVTTRVTGSTAVNDPFAGLPIPTPGACSSTTSYKTTVTISPQTWCGGVTFNAQANVTFSPGVYIVDGGTFRVNAGATLQGSGVTIILTGSGVDYGTVNINGNATIALTAPTTGTYAGILFLQDRAAPSGTVNYFNGGADMNLKGVVYFPNQEIRFAGGSSQNSSGCTRLFGQSVTFIGNANIGNDCSGMNIPKIIRPPRLVE